MNVKQLTANPENPRTISKQKLAMLKKSLTEFGDLSGIVFNRRTKRLVGGHQRITQINKETPVFVEKKYSKPSKTGTVAEGHILIFDERHPYREVDWDEIKEKAANIAANKGAGEWDMPKLASWMEEIGECGFDLDLTMFDESERSLLSGSPSKVQESEEDDEVPDAPKVAKTKLGNIYQLGEHRLICGDSTDIKVLEKLMEDEKADVTFTSPPYNANTKQMQKGKAKKLYETYSDDLSSSDYVDFASKVLSNCVTITRGFIFWNVNYNSNSRAEFIKQILPFIDLLDETIAWKKTALPVPHGLTRTWEPVFVFNCRSDKKRLGHVNKTEFNYWDVNNAHALDESHRAAFPVALPGKALDLVEDCKSVFDPFGGSGTTLIAAEKRKMKCFMIELDPIYCDVIVARWEKFTGQKARLINETTKKR